MTNALAYYTIVLVTAVKSFIAKPDCEEFIFIAKSATSLARIFLSNKLFFTFFNIFSGAWGEGRGLFIIFTIILRSFLSLGSFSIKAQIKMSLCLFTKELLSKFHGWYTLRRKLH
jgi:hypothetical protein